MLVACHWCGKLIKRTPSDIKQKKRVFCSKKHYYKWLETKEGKQMLIENARAGGKTRAQIERCTQENSELPTNSKIKQIQEIITIKS